MSDPIVDPADLATYLNDSTINNERAMLMLRLAQERCESFLAPLPPAAETVVLDVAARGYVTTAQSRGRQMASAGSMFTESGGRAGGIWLTRENRAELRRLAGNEGSGGGAFSIDLLAADYVAPTSAGHIVTPWNNT